MGNWVFIAGEVSGSFNGARRLYVYDTVSDIVTIGNNITDTIISTTKLHITENSFYFSPTYYVGTSFIGALQSRLSDIDYFSNSYYISSDSRYGIPLRFNGIDFLPYKNASSSPSYHLMRLYDTGSPVLMYTFSPSPYPVNSIPVLTIVGSTLYAFYTVLGALTTLKWRTSTNGITWSSESSTSSGTFYIDGTLKVSMISGSYGIVTTGFPRTSVFTLNGGTTWTVIGSGAPLTNNGCLATSDGLYIISDNLIYKSTNGTTWTLVYTHTEIINDVVYGDSKYMIVGAVSSLATTTDFVTYTPFTEVDFSYHDVYTAIYTTAVVSVSSGPPILSINSLPTAIVNELYNETIGTTTGGIVPISWSGTVKDSTNVTVFTIVANVISFTPISLGEYTVQVTVTDALLQTDTGVATFSVTTSGGVTALSIVPAIMPDATVNVAYTASVGTAIGGTSPYFWSLISKSWTDAANLSTAGLLTTTFTTDGSENVEVMVTDSSVPALTDSAIVPLQVNVNENTSVISGTLRLDTSLGNFAARTVHLYTYPNGDKVGTTVSDGLTGAWEFNNVAPGDYFVVGVASQSDYETYSRDFDALGAITVI